MVIPCLLGAALFGAPAQQRPTSRPTVDVQLVSKDVLLIRSSYNIDSAYLSDQSEWCSYFVDYAPTGRQATVLIRTKQTPLRLVIETSTVRGIGMRERHEFTIDNPTTHRAYPD
ncbi:MAG: hypothetical protein U1D30_09280 [Planctomycetota bacterium]